MNTFRGHGSSKTVKKEPTVAGHRPPHSPTMVVAAGILIFLLLPGCSNAPAQTTSMPAETAGDPASSRIRYGKRIFAAQGCQTCHGATGQGGAETGTGAGPHISPPPQSFATFTTLVREPRGQMPGYSNSKLSDTDLADVYAFLKSIAKGGQREPDLLRAGNAQDGKKFYTSYGCYECHGNHAEGSSVTGPRLTPVPVALEAFMDYIRHPAGQMPPYTSNVVTSSELEEIYAFLRSRPQPLSPNLIPMLQLPWRQQSAPKSGTSLP